MKFFIVIRPGSSRFLPVKTGKQRLKLFHLIIASIRCGKPRSQRLEDPLNLEAFNEVFCRRSVDDSTYVRVLNDQPFRIQSRKGFPKRRAANANVLGKRLLSQWCSGRNYP